jgi:hypothetical protein
MAFAAVGCPMLAFKTEFGQAVIKGHQSPGIDGMTEFAPFIVDELFSLATVGVVMADEALCRFEAKLKCGKLGFRLWAPVAGVTRNSPMCPTQRIGRLIVLG